VFMVSPSSVHLEQALSIGPLVIATIITLWPSTVAKIASEGTVDMVAIPGFGRGPVTSSSDVNPKRRQHGIGHVGQR